MKCNEYCFVEQNSFLSIAATYVNHFKQKVSTINQTELLILHFYPSENDPNVKIFHNYTPLPPQPFYGPFSGTTQVSRCQKRIYGLYGAWED